MDVFVFIWVGGSCPTQKQKEENPGPSVRLGTDLDLSGNLVFEHWNSDIDLSSPAHPIPHEEFVSKKYRETVTKRQ